jgi:hypothetical protein
LAFSFFDLRLARRRMKESAIIKDDARQFFDLWLKFLITEQILVDGIHINKI